MAIMRNKVAVLRNNFQSLKIIAIVRYKVVAIKIVANVRFSSNFEIYSCSCKIAVAVGEITFLR